MVDARRVFDNMVQRNTVSWNSLIRGYVDNGESEVALEVFFGMEDDKDGPVRDARTYVAALRACATLAGRTDGVLGKLTDSGKWVEKGKFIHSLAVRGGCCNKFVENTLVDMYAKCGDMAKTRAVFDRMIDPDVVSWTALLQGYVENGESEQALQIFEAMDSACSPNALTFVVAATACASLAATQDGNSEKVIRSKKWLEKGKAFHSRAVMDCCCDGKLSNTLIYMYGKCGSVVHAQAVFNNMVNCDEVSWNCLIQGYVDNGKNEVALELVAAMRASGIELNSATFIAAFEACGNLMALEDGKAFHAEIKRRGMDKNLLLETCLLDFYGKCGSMEIARQIFDRISEKNIVAWNTLMCGYSLQGDTDQVFKLFEEMKKQKVAASEVTFVCLLASCSHAGLTERGKELFKEMHTRYNINPTRRHYACMVDLLGRANLLEEAVEMVRRMPFRADSVVWTEILAACRKWRNVAVAKVAYESLLKLDEKDPIAYVLMANIYGGDADSDEV